MRPITINKVWPIRVAKRKVHYRKPLSLSELDSIILSFLMLFEDSIDFKELGKLLGFALENDPEKQTYYDPAEESIYNSLLETLIRFHLIESVKEESGCNTIRTTFWGINARNMGIKYLFYEGIILNYEHHLLFYEETIDKIFPFYKFNLCSEISESKEIGPFVYNTIEQEENLSLKRGITNFKIANSEEKSIEIQWVFDDISKYSELKTELELTLSRGGETYLIETTINKVRSQEFEEIIQDHPNAILYQDWLLLLRYEAYKRDSKLLLAGELSEFIPHIDWTSLLTDQRIVWDAELFELLADEKLANNSIWNAIIINCSESVLISNVEAYSRYWNWPRLTNRLEVGYILNSINKHPWDLDGLIEKCNQNELEDLVLSITETEAVNDWSNITRKVSFDFIKEHIEKFPFDLYYLVRSRDSNVQELLISNPDLSWDWAYIINIWPIKFILKEFDTLKSKLDIVLFFNRLLRNYSEFKIAFLNFSFQNYFADNKDNVITKIGSTQDVVLNDKTLKILSENDNLFWGVEGIPGVESNANLRWERVIFEKYGDLVKTEEGFDNVSLTIDNIELIEEVPTFSWNFEIISERDDLNWSFDFIERNRTKLNPSSILKSIPSTLVSKKLFYFISWFKEITDSTFLINHISNNFSFKEIEVNRKILTDNNINVDWNFILKDIKIDRLNEIMISYEGRITELPSSEDLLNELSQRCELEFILEKPDLGWNWKTITTKKIPVEKLTDKDFQFEFASFIYWPYIIENFIKVQDLVQINQLTTLAWQISQGSESIGKESWRIITNKMPPFQLWKFIDETKSFDIFLWDWDIISSSKHIPVDHSFLSTYKSMLNWSLLSKNPLLSAFFQFNKAVYSSTNEWIDRTLEYLYANQNEWDFNALSAVNNLTWNESIISKFEDKWDWTILSRESALLTRYDKEKRITEYDERRLKRFSSFIDWEIISGRYEVYLTTGIVEAFINRQWDWSLLSTHPKFDISPDFLIVHSSKPWNYKALSVNKKLDINKKLILQLSYEDWDYTVFSSAKWLDNDVLNTLSDKPWDWGQLSENQHLIFDLNLIKLFIKQDESVWRSILSSNNIHITADTLDLLNINGILKKNEWQLLSGHSNLDFIQHPLLLDRFRYYWDWNTLIEENKINVNDLMLLKENQEQINWDLIGKSDQFEPTIDILFEFKELLNWKVISQKVILDLNSLRSFKDYLDWDHISKSTSMSFTPELIDEFRESWNYYYLRENIALTTKVRKYINNLIYSIPELQLVIKLKERESKWSGYIYHFTHLSNAVEIIKSKKILCRNKIKKFADASGIVVDRRHTAHEFARFYFRPQTPTQYYNECLGRDLDLRSFDGALKLGLPKCPIPVFFRFNMQEVMLKMHNNCYVSNGNMQTNWAELKPVSQMLSTFNFDDVYSTFSETSDGNWRTYINYSQQEFLIKDEFDFNYLNSYDIIVRSDKDKQQLIHLLKGDPAVHSKIIIDTYETSIYHNTNKEIIYSYENGILDVTSNYKGDGYRSGKIIIEFNKKPEFELISGSINSISGKRIIAYPKVKLAIEETIKFKLLFYDDFKKEEWMIFEGSAS